MAGNIVNSLLTNGGFENDLTGWSYTISTWLGLQGSVTIETTNVNGGGKCAKLVLTNPGEATGGQLRLWQSVTLKPNTLYRYQLAIRGDDLATFRLRCPNPEGGHSLHEVVPLDVSGITGANWRHIWHQTRTFADTTDYFVEVWIGIPPAGETRTLWVDAVSVYELTERPERWIGVHGDSNVTHLGRLDAFEGDAPQSFMRTSFVKAQRRRDHIFHPVIASQAGYRVREVYNTLGDIISASPKPEACVIAVGTNDVTVYYDTPGGNPNYAPEAVAPVYLNIAAALLTASIVPVFMTIPPRLDHDVEPWNEVIRAAGTVQGAQLVDAYAIGMAANMPGDPDYYYDDDRGIHYRTPAHVLFGNALGNVW